MWRIVDRRKRTTPLFRSTRSSRMGLVSEASSTAPCRSSYPNLVIVWVSLLIRSRFCFAYVLWGTWLVYANVEWVSVILQCGTPLLVWNFIEFGCCLHEAVYLRFEKQRLTRYLSDCQLCKLWLEFRILQVYLWCSYKYFFILQHVFLLLDWEVWNL